MSILLDALRKSEQRERLGAVPDIHDSDPASSDPERRRWIVPALAVIAILVLLGAGYVAWRSWSQPRIPVAEPELAPGVAVTAPAESMEPPAAGNPTDEAVAAAPAEESPSPRLDRQPRSPVETLSGERPYRPANPPAAAQVTEPPASTRQPAAETREPAAPNRSAAAIAAAAQQALADRPANPRPRPEAPAEPDPPTGDRPGLVSFWQLPQDVRSGLPDLKINVMVYNDDPARRFIIMGGKRYREGTEVQRNLTLEEVQRDRALFRHGAYLFYVKQ